MSGVCSVQDYSEMYKGQSHSGDQEGGRGIMELPLWESIRCICHARGNRNTLGDYPFALGIYLDVVPLA